MYRAAELETPHAVGAAQGCEHCAGEGYRGRMAVFEVLDRSARPGTAARPKKTLMQRGLTSAAMLSTTPAEVAAHCPEPTA